MPILRISMLEGRGDEQKAAAAAALTAALEVHFGCQPEDVSILFEEVARENWVIAGKLLSESPAPKRS